MKQELKTVFKGYVKDVEDPGDQPEFITQCPNCGNVESYQFDYSSLPQDGCLQCLDHPQLSYEMNCIKCKRNYIVSYKVELTNIKSTKVQKKQYYTYQYNKVLLEYD